MYGYIWGGDVESRAGPPSSCKSAALAAAELWACTTCSGVPRRREGSTSSNAAIGYATPHVHVYRGADRTGDFEHVQNFRARSLRRIGNAENPRRLRRAPAPGNPALISTSCSAVALLAYGRSPRRKAPPSFITAMRTGMWPTLAT